MVVKGLILSGGTGTRLRPLTYTGAKQLLPVANVPILFYALQAMRDAGIDEIGIVVGDTSTEVKHALQKRPDIADQLTFIQQDYPLGLAHAVQIAEPFLQQDPFVMFLGDNLISDGIADAVRQFHKDAPTALVLVGEVDDPQQFGVVELEDKSIRRLVEKPQSFVSRFAMVGVYLFQATIHQAVRSIQISARGELEITDAIQWLVDAGQTVHAYPVNGWWKDTGKPMDLLEANRCMVEKVEHKILGKIDTKSQIIGRVCIEEGTEIRNSVLRGPLVIGKNSFIEDAYLGPFTSIGDDVKIFAAEIENSIVLNGCRIHRVHRIDQSILGRKTSISQSDKKPQAIRLLLGDESSCDL